MGAHSSFLRHQLVKVGIGHPLPQVEKNTSPSVTCWASAFASGILPSSRRTVAQFLLWRKCGGGPQRDSPAEKNASARTTIRCLALTFRLWVHPAGDIEPLASPNVVRIPQPIGLADGLNAGTIAAGDAVQGFAPAYDVGDPAGWRWHVASTGNAQALAGPDVVGIS